MVCFSDYWCLGKKDAPEDKWQPMMRMLCEQAREHANKGKKVAVGFAVYNKVVRDYIRTQMANV